MNTQRMNLQKEIGRRLRETVLLMQFDQKHGDFLDTIDRLSGVAESVNAIYFDQKDLEAVTEYFGRDGWTPDAGDVFKVVDGVHVWIHGTGVTPVPFSFPLVPHLDCVGGEGGKVALQTVPVIHGNN